MDIKFGFGVLGHHSRDGCGEVAPPGWMEFATWSRDLGHSRTCAWGWVGQLGVGLGSLGLGWAPWGVGHGFLLGVRWLGVGVGQLGQLTGLKRAWRKLGFVGVGVRGVTCR